MPNYHADGEDACSMKWDLSQGADELRRQMVLKKGRQCAAGLLGGPGDSAQHTSQFYRSLSPGEPATDYSDNENNYVQDDSCGLNFIS